MLEIIRRHVVVPLFERLGTITATAIAPLVASADLRIQIGAGVAAVGLVAYDLVVGYFNRKLLVNGAIADAIEGVLKGRDE